jgi:hypothetical protein
VPSSLSSSLTLWPDLLVPPAIEALQLIKRVSELEDPGEVFKNEFPKLFLA